MFFSSVQIHLALSVPLLAQEEHLSLATPFAGKIEHIWQYDPSGNIKMGNYKGGVGVKPRPINNDGVIQQDSVQPVSIPNDFHYVVLFPETGTYGAMNVRGSRDPILEGMSQAMGNKPPQLGIGTNAEPKYSRFPDSMYCVTCR